MRRFALLSMLFARVVAAGVPQTVGFSARIVDEKSGAAVSGEHQFKFALFDAATGGTSVWSDARSLTLTDGLLFVELGETQPLSAALFAGNRLFLEVSYDGVAMEPRLPLASVPYALRADQAGAADTVGGLGADQLQRRVTGQCAPGTFATRINADGSLTCAPDALGTGTITSVSAGSGLSGGGSSGAVTLGLMSCPANQVLKSDGATWACARDEAGGLDGVTAGAGLMGGGTSGTVSLGLMSCPANQTLKSNGSTWACAPETTGDITGILVGVGSGLIGGAASGDATLSLLTTCSAGQLLKWTGSAWACAADVDTNSGGTVTSVSASPAGGLTSTGSSSVSLSLSTACSPGQMLKWNGSAWGCANDVDTNSGGTVTGVTAGNGLTGGVSSGSVQLDVTVGTGLLVTADAVSLDTNYTDARYVNAAGDTMTGPLDLGQQRLTNRGCPTNYTRVGPGLCVEHNDQNGFTFTACADRCRVAGTHLCSSAEMRSVLASGVTLGSGPLLDWVDDQVGIGQAIYVASTVAETMDGARATSTASFCRCCANVE